EVRSAALHGRGCPRASQICVGALWRRRAYVRGPAFRIYASQELLLSPLDDDQSGRTSRVRAPLADVADPEAARWAPDTDRAHSLTVTRPALRIKATKDYMTACGTSRSC